jgi:hypothetical protein
MIHRSDDVIDRFKLTANRDRARRAGVMFGASRDGR